MPSPHIKVLLELGCSDTRIGAVNDMLDLAEFAKDHGVEITFCGPLDRATRDQLNRRGLRTIRGRSRQPSKLGLPIYALSVLVWWIRLFWLRPQIVHLNFRDWHSSLGVAAYWHSLPVVCRAGGGFNARSPSNRYVRAFAASCIPHAQALLDSPDADKVFVLGDFYRPERLTASRELSRPLPPHRDGRPLFVFLGQLVERKGVATLVRAFAAMKSDADLLLVGGDWNAEGYPREVRDLIESLGMSQRVSCENHREDVAAVLNHCDVFVLPSLSDARPRSMIEAMLVGLPVIASRVGGIPTLVDDGMTGLLVPPSNVELLAAALDRLAQSPELRKRMGEAGRTRAEAQCRPENSTRRGVALYRFLASGKPMAAMSASARLDTGELFLDQIQHNNPGLASSETRDPAIAAGPAA